ncbi:MAG: hypothetical protein R8M45_04060, partial [Ghiorsea sp.]
MKYSTLTLMAGLLVLSGCMAMHPMMHGDESDHDMGSMEMPMMMDEESDTQEKDDEQSSSTHGKHKHQLQNSRPIWG